MMACSFKINKKRSSCMDSVQIIKNVTRFMRREAEAQWPEIPLKNYRYVLIYLYN